MKCEEILEVKECPCKDTCLHLNFEPAARVLAQRGYLSKRVDEMERIMNLATEQIEELREKNRVLEEERKSLKQELREAVGLRFKPNLRKEEERPKKKRALPLAIEALPGKDHRELMSMLIFIQLNAIGAVQKILQFIRTPLESIS